VASYKDDLSVFVRAKTATRPRPEVAGSSRVDAGELRARAARYRQLAEILYDPHVVAEVQACARELDIEASWIERRASFGTRMVTPRYRIGN
jgi:hypothetical protein